jgi:hypothetical protein
MLAKKFGETSYIPLELPPIYTKPPRYEKTLTYPPIFHFLSLRTLQGYNGYINIYMSIIPSTPKLRHFGLVQNGVVLQILVFFFFEKKKEIEKKKKKKKEEKKGWLEPPLAQKMGWPDHPIFGQGVAEATPGLWGWSGHPERPKKKKKNVKMGFGLWGWPDHPLGLGGGFGTPPTGRRGWLRPLGVVRPPPKSQTHFFLFFFFFFFWPFGVAGPPPKAWGGFGHLHKAVWGWPKPPLGQKWGGPATPFFGQGVALATPFFLFFFSISFFFSKKKKKNPKTTPFWAKRHSFGVNGSLDNLPPKGS